MRSGTRVLCIHARRWIFFSPHFESFSLFPAFNYTTRCAEDWKTMGICLDGKNPGDKHNRINLAGRGREAYICRFSTGFSSLLLRQATTWWTASAGLHERLCWKFLGFYISALVAELSKVRDAFSLWRLYRYGLHAALAVFLRAGIIRSIMIVLGLGLSARIKLTIGIECKSKITAWHDMWYANLHHPSTT